MTLGTTYSVTSLGSGFQERACQIGELKVKRKLGDNTGIFRSLLPLALSSLPRFHLNIKDEVDDNSNIEKREHDLEPGDVTDDLEQLPGQEGRGQDQSHIFGPYFSEHQSDAFQQMETRGGEDSEADLLEPVRIDHRNLLQNQAGEAALRIETQVDDEARHHVDEISVHKLERSNAQENEESRFQQLPYADSDDPSLAC